VAMVNCLRKTACVFGTQVVVASRRASHAVSVKCFSAPCCCTIDRKRSRNLARASQDALVEARLW
jgi:hypothetical protein